MDIILAKWFFHTALLLSPGTGLEWPLMRAGIQASTAIQEVLEVDGVGAPLPTCSALQPVCTVPWEGARGHWTQRFCVGGPGVYTFAIAFGLSTPETDRAVTGRVWLRRELQARGSAGMRGETTLLAGFRAAPGEASQAAGSVTVAAPVSACYSITYDATGPAWIDPDQRAGFLTVHRAGP
jgi:hypothetical protein